MCGVMYFVAMVGMLMRKGFGENEMRQNFVQFVCLQVIFTTIEGQLSVDIYRASVLVAGAKLITDLIAQLHAKNKCHVIFICYRSILLTPCPG